MTQGASTEEVILLRNENINNNRQLERRAVSRLHPKRVMLVGAN